MLWFPHAKINLGLSVLNKRSDGYHAIESLLLPITLYDILEINQSEAHCQDQLFVTGLALDCGIEENLVWKALQLLRKHYPFPQVKIHLHKQIPSRSGLGGGSSDAAHTLLGINQLFKLKINKKTLMTLASELGSDCPFFLELNAQYAEGRGEILRPHQLHLDQELKLFLIVPDFSISTTEAYGNIQAKAPQIPLLKTLEKPIMEWKRFVHNDFENIIFKEFTALAHLKQMLYEKGALYSSLSGSGSALYALFPEEKAIALADNYKSYWLNFPA